MYIFCFMPYLPKSLFCKSQDDRVFKIISYPYKHMRATRQGKLCSLTYDSASNTRKIMIHSSAGMA